MPAIIIALLAILLGLLAVTPASSAPGEPRLIQGTLEWPPELATQKFVVVRADTGDLYYVDVSTAQRRISVALTGGTRIALLGVEGARPQEVTALAISGGDAAALARAITTGVPQDLATPSPKAGTEAKTPATPVVTPPAGPAASPSVAAATPPASESPSALPTAAAAAPAQATPPPPASTADSKAAAPAAAAAKPAPGAPAAQTTPASAAPAAPARTAPAPAPDAPASSVVASAAGAPDVVASGSSEVVADASRAIAPNVTGAGRRWTEIRGVVEKVGANGLLLRGDDGTLITVDVARLNANFAEHIKPGMVVAVYGHPVETKFTASGVMYSDGPPPTPARATGEPARKRPR